MELKSKLEDYTEAEFKVFMAEIFKENSAPTDELLDPLLSHFELITEHPSGTDLIYYPEGDNDGSMQTVIAAIKQWRAAHNKPGFKS